VGFRWWTVHLARSLGVRGIVRNRPDGSVEVRAVGTPGALSELRRALADGPPHAVVRGLESIPPEGGLPPEFRAER
jgi:acylphosphatase